MNYVVSQIILGAIPILLTVAIVIIANAIILKDVFLHSGKHTTRAIGIVLMPLFAISGLLYAMDTCRLSFIAGWVTLLFCLGPLIRVGMAIKTRTLKKIPFILFAAIIIVAGSVLFAYQLFRTLSSIPAIL